MHKFAFVIFHLVPRAHTRFAALRANFVGIAFDAVLKTVHNLSSRLLKYILKRVGVRVTIAASFPKTLHRKPHTFDEHAETFVRLSDDKRAACVRRALRFRRAKLQRRAF